MKPALKRAATALRRRRPSANQPDEQVENKEERKVERKKGRFQFKLGSSKSVPGTKAKQTSSTQAESSVLHEAHSDFRDVDILNDSSGPAKTSGLAPEPQCPDHPPQHSHHLPHPAIPLAHPLHSAISNPHASLTAFHSLQGSHNMRVQALDIVHAAGNIDDRRIVSSNHFHGPVFAIGPFLAGTGKVGDPSSSGVMLVALYTSGFFIFLTPL